MHIVKDYLTKSQCLVFDALMSKDFDTIIDLCAASGRSDIVVKKATRHLIEVLTPYLSGENQKAARGEALNALYQPKWTKYALDFFAAHRVEIAAEIDAQMNEEDRKMVPYNEAVAEIAPYIAPMRFIDVLDMVKLLELADHPEFKSVLPTVWFKTRPAIMARRFHGVLANLDEKQANGLRKDMPEAFARARDWIDKLNGVRDEVAEAS